MPDFARPRRPSRDQEAVLAVADDLVHRRVVVGDHRQPEGHRLVQVQAEALPAARGDADVGRRRTASGARRSAGPRGPPRRGGRARRRARARPRSRSTWPLISRPAPSPSTRRNALQQLRHRLALAEEAGGIEERAGVADRTRCVASRSASSSGWMPQCTRGLSIPIVAHSAPARRRSASRRRRGRASRARRRSRENCSQTNRPTVRTPVVAQRLDRLEAVVLVEEREVELVLAAPARPARRPGSGIAEASVTRGWSQTPVRSTNDGRMFVGPGRPGEHERLVTERVERGAQLARDDALPAVEPVGADPDSHRREGRWVRARC